MTVGVRLGLFAPALALIAAVGCGPSPTEVDLRAELEASRAEVARLKEELKGAGPLIQTGTVEARAGELAISYPREYLRPPTLRFPKRDNVDVSYVVVKQSGSGCILSVSSVGTSNNAPRLLDWIAEGEARPSAR